MHTGFQILRCSKFDIPNSSGNNKSLVFIWAWSSIFISETVVMQISQLFMFQATNTWFIVAQVMSFGEWLSIIARSELGSDLDCSVINARSELGSDLDCYELKHIFISLKTYLIFLQPRALECIFPWNWFTNTWKFSLIFHPLQIIFIHYKSRIATAIRGLWWIKMTMVISGLKAWRINLQVALCNNSDLIS